MYDNVNVCIHVVSILCSFVENVVMYFSADALSNCYTMAVVVGSLMMRSTLRHSRPCEIHYNILHERTHNEYNSNTNINIFIHPKLPKDSRLEHVQVVFTSQRRCKGTISR